MARWPGDQVGRWAGDQVGEHLWVSLVVRKISDMLPVLLPVISTSLTV